MINNKWGSCHLEDTVQEKVQVAVLDHGQSIAQVLYYCSRANNLDGRASKNLIVGGPALFNTWSECGIGPPSSCLFATILIQNPQTCGDRRVSLSTLVPISRYVQKHCRMDFLAETCNIKH